jgi:protein TonB
MPAGRHKFARWQKHSAFTNCNRHQSNAKEELLVSPQKAIDEYMSCAFERRRIVSLRSLKRVLMLSVFFATAVVASHAWAEGGITRKLKTKVAPEYPALARRMNITGVVKLEVTVAPNGSVKTAKVVGGHPILVNAALDAVKKWRYETGTEETVGILEFRFDPSE